MSSNPERRREYDDEVRVRAGRSVSWRPEAEPLVPRRRDRGEPLGAALNVEPFRTVALFDSFGTYRPSFDELFDRLWRNFTLVSRPEAERLENLTVEVVLTPEEAWEGGAVTVEIPARSLCPSCGGHGAVGAYECWRCEGHGALTAEYPVQVEYPPGIRDGFAARIPLQHLGIDNFYLTVVFRVG